MTDHGLEAGVQFDEEGGLFGQCQYPFLGHGTVDVVVLNDHVLLENLDGEQLFRRLVFRQEHL